jgi:hypothetical protein
MTMSAKDHEFYSYLDNNNVLIEDWGYVALSQDRHEIFICLLMADNTPDRDPPHLNWSLVTAPEPEFLEEVNKVFGTAFRMKSFSGR